jgi:hypothetical protein
LNRNSEKSSLFKPEFARPREILLNCWNSSGPFAGPIIARFRPLQLLSVSVFLVRGWSDTHSQNKSFTLHCHSGSAQQQHSEEPNEKFAVQIFSGLGGSLFIRITGMGPGKSHWINLGNGCRSTGSSRIQRQYHREE